MAAYRERQQNIDENRRLRNQEYIDGSAVRKTLAVPEQTPEQVKEPERKEKKQIADRPLVGIRRQMDMLSLVVIGVAFAFVMVLAIRYLKVHAAETELDKAIVNLTKDYDKLRGENDARLVDIADNINLNDVYQVAVGELGMVYPNHNQIIEFQCAGSGYVRQYSDVPEAADEGDVSAIADVLRHLMK